MIPPIIHHCGFDIVRGDLVPGGLKAPALIKWLPELGYSHFVYCGSVFGYGAAALAYAAGELGFRATIFLSDAKYKPEWLENISMRSDLRFLPACPLSHLQREARIFCSKNTSAFYLEPGTFGPGFLEILTSYVQMIAAGHDTRRMWVPVVSGAFARAMIQAFPNKDIIGVAAARTPGRANGLAHLYQSPEKYHQPAKLLPPYPASPFSDAKIWQFLEHFGQPQDLIWNIAA